MCGNSPEGQLYGELMKCKSIGEMFNYLSNYFDLFSKPVPAVYKALIVTSICTAIKWLNPKIKK